MSVIRLRNTRCHLINMMLFLAFTLLLLSDAAASKSIIKSLPGFDGNLPFVLETGWVYLPFLFLVRGFVKFIFFLYLFFIMIFSVQVYWRGRIGSRAAILLLHRVWEEPKRWPSCALAHWWPWMLCPVWNYIWNWCVRVFIFLTP
jgi:hypothetical protein